MLIESGIFLKIMLVVIYAKIRVILTIYENFKSFFDLSSASKHLETWVPV